MKIGSVSNQGAGSSPRGDTPPSALVLRVSGTSEKLEELTAGERLQEQGAMLMDTQGKCSLQQQGPEEN